MIKPIIVSASDDGFFEFLVDMLHSLDDVGIGKEVDRGVIDLGLTSDQRQVLISRGIKLASPTMIALPKRLELRKIDQGFLARPRYPEIFPDNDPILHIDADAWVQLKSAIDTYIAAAKSGALAIADHYDRSYQTTESIIRLRLNLLSDYSSTDRASKILLRNSFYNAGVFCFPRKSSVWQTWEQTFSAGLAQSRLNRIDDQAALNLVLFERQMEIFPVASINNWMTHLSTPAVHPEKDLLMAPLYPHESLGIVHVSGGNKSCLRTLNIIGDGIASFSLDRRSVLRWFSERRAHSSPRN